jgi:CBS domain-containing protein
MIRDICSKPPVTISADATVREAARAMRDKRVGALVVTNSAKPVGILTDRDIAVSVVGTDRNPATVPVREVMHASPTTIYEDQGVHDAVKMFSAHGFRRLPVVNRKGELTGIIALDDVLMLLGDEMLHVTHAVERELGRSWAA